MSCSEEEEESTVNYSEEDYYDETPAWLTEQFIEQLLRRGRNDATLRVTHIDVDSVLDASYVSNVLRVAVDYRRKQGRKQVSKTCSLIVKTVSLEEDFSLQVKHLSNADYFFQELNMYEVTLPQMYKLADDKTGSGAEHLRPTTTYYKTDRTDTIVLEDLGSLGYKKADPLQGLDLQHCLLAIKALAKLHASSMVLHSQDPTAMDLYEMVDNEDYLRLVTADSKATFTTLATEVESWSGFERFGDKLKSYATSYSWSRELEKHRACALKVLNHAEYNTQSLLFRYENGEAVDVKMLKLKYLYFASPAFDILHFLYSSPNQDVLENHRDRILVDYVTTLKDTLVFLGDDRAVSLDDINKELEHNAQSAIDASCYACVDLAMPWDDPDEETSGDIYETIFCGRVFRKMFQIRLTEMEKQGVL